MARQRTKRRQTRQKADIFAAPKPKKIDIPHFADENATYKQVAKGALRNLATNLNPIEAIKSAGSWEEMKWNLTPRIAFARSWRRF